MYDSIDYKMLSNLRDISMWIKASEPLKYDKMVFKIKCHTPLYCIFFYVLTQQWEIQKIYCTGLKVCLPSSLVDTIYRKLLQFSGRISRRKYSTQLGVHLTGERKYTLILNQGVEVVRSSYKSFHGYALHYTDIK